MSSSISQDEFMIIVNIFTVVLNNMAPVVKLKQGNISYVGA